jgi:hypothetical protein
MDLRMTSSVGSRFSGLATYNPIMRNLKNIMPSFPRRQRRVILAWMLVSFVAGPAAVQVMILVMNVP